jgi:predicted chitinase
MNSKGEITSGTMGEISIQVNGGGNGKNERKTIMKYDRCTDYGI